MHTNMDLHFSQVAREYRRIRTTDSEPIDYIVSRLNGLKKLVGADIGCGAGRYSLMLSQALGKRFSLYCCDRSPEMLRELEKHMGSNGIHKFTVINSSSEKIPLDNDTLGALFTFNAIHHFSIIEFFQECSRLLVGDGQLFVYTRLKEQNSRNIWGKYFPGFLKKETRLYQQGEIEKGLSKVSSLKLNSVTKFHFQRSVSLDRLVHIVKRRHYSTFSLYNDTELAEALIQFEKNIRSEFSDTKNVYWEDENIMYHISNRK